MTTEARLKRLRDIERELDLIIKEPKNATVADYAALQKEYSIIKYQLETEANIKDCTDAGKIRKEAVSRIVNENRNIR